MKRLIYGAFAAILAYLMYKIAIDPYIPESHTTKEWAEKPDKVSIKNKWYVVSDFRTDDDISIPRFKFGDGVTKISKLPFCTAAITENDIDKWDDIVLQNEADAKK